MHLTKLLRKKKGTGAFLPTAYSLLY